MNYSLLFCLFFISGFACSDFKNSKERVAPTKASQTNSLRYPVYTSPDQGLTWNPLPLNLPENTQISFLKDFKNELLIASDNNGLFLSTDKLSNSKQISSTLPGQKINALQVYGNEIYVGVYHQGVFVSSDQGESWKSLNENLTDFSIQAILKTENALVIGTDSGIFISEAGGDWKAFFSEAQVVSLNESKGKIVAGTSKGTIFSNDQGKNWNWIHQAGAAHNTEIIEDNIYIMNVSGDLFRSKDWGNSWQAFYYKPRKSSYVYDIIASGQFLIFSNNYGVHKSTGIDLLSNLIYPIEDFVFFDFHFKNNILYAGTRHSNEWRNRK